VQRAKERNQRPIRRRHRHGTWCYAVRIAGTALGRSADYAFGEQTCGRPGFRTAFEGVTRERASALFVFDDVFMTTHKEQILSWAARARLPVISQYAELTEAGGLLAYGPNIPDIYRRAASYVDRILKGAKPADLTVEQPTKLELVLNAKSAKTLGFKIPNSILLRADKVLD
jgi:ABC-type uncharacterized transport system substrate-binding protein